MYFGEKRYISPLYGFWGAMAGIPPCIRQWWVDTPRFFRRFSKTCTAIHTSFPPRLCKFQTQVTQGQVARSCQVTSPQKRFESRHSYTECPITLKLSAIGIRTSMYNMFVSEFVYLWPKVRSILRPIHYKSMGEHWKAPVLDENHCEHSQTSV